MKQLNENDLLKCAGDERSRNILHEIFMWRKEVSTSNKFATSDTLFKISLCGLELNFRHNNAFSAIETFQEIFIDHGHFKHNSFVPKNATVILDIGANQGFYSLKAGLINPKCRIIAYEPNPFEFELLNLNLLSNKPVSSNIAANRKAVTGKAGEIKLEIIPEIGSIGSTDLKHSGRKWLKDEFIREIYADSVTLDSIFIDNNLSHVDILKMDVEGAEIDILTNFHGFNLIEKAVIEYHSPLGRKQLIKLMSENGFLMVLDDSSHGDYYGDAYFVKNIKTGLYYGRKHI